MFEEKDDTILARWLAGTLTPEEHAEFEQSIEYKDYVQIVEGLDRFEKPDFDQQALRTRIKNKIDRLQKGKLIRLKPLLYAASVAASVIVIIGLFFNKISYETSIGQQLAVTLPNGAEVQLNAKSQLTHSRFFWKNSQKVSLQGEGFFKVEKGKGFAVETSSGTISVLGTQFNIKTRTKLFELTCYQGKVEFEAATTREKIILNKGESVQLLKDIFEKETTEDSAPSWISGRSSFRNAPLNEVLNELQRQYDMTIENETVDLSKHVTTSFAHDNLDMALMLVLEPMSIEYELSNDRKTLKLLSSSP